MVVAREHAMENVPTLPHPGRYARIGATQSHKRTGEDLALDTVIRDARPEDAAEIAAIYNEGIVDRIATLEMELRDAVERRAWLSSRWPRHPVLVAERAARIVGWGSLNQFNPRPVYDHVADFSIYVTRHLRGQGIGTLLLAALEQRAVALGYHKMVLAAMPWNELGMRLYQRSGYRTVGIYREQGLLDGHWVDVVVMEKIL